ncbi:MAG TPA: hypothetical protein VFN35_03955 [Ktedonobacteraceae bacterium]|nr:hypothetical protein [Ktedonobacteraceae bacterium]
MKKLKLFYNGMALLCIAFLFIACNEAAPKTNLPQLNNGMPGGKLSFTHKLDESRLTIVSSFSTSYNTAEWRVTDSKSINIQLTENSSFPQDTVLVEHVHVDVSLKSTLALLDGWSQDSADFKLSTGSEPGVLVSSQYPYVNIMAIEGFSQTLLNSWTYYTDNYAITDVEQKRLTEDNLVREGGVYANKIQVVWFLLAKYPGEEHYHSEVFTDEFIIPVANARS